MERNNNEIFKSINERKNRWQKNKINNVKAYMDEQKNEIINYTNQILNSKWYSKNENSYNEMINWNKY